MTAPTGDVVGQSASLSASSLSDGDYSYSTSSSVCSVTSSGAVTMLHAGDCAVDVSQAATADYTEQSHTQTITIGKSSTTLAEPLVTGSSISGCTCSLPVQTPNTPC